MSAVGAAGALEALAAMDRSALADRWVAVFACPPPRHAQAPLLLRALAWQAQMCETSGTASVDRAIRGLRRSASRATPAPSLAPGTQLLREWQGRTHYVTVLPSGFAYAGVRYRSLTAIARVITGTAWSGPLFFGLRS